MNFRNQSGLLAGVLLVLLQASAFFANPARAQDSGTALEEVTVTAQRIEQNLQDVPVSVTAISGEMLAERNLNDLTQITQVAPSLQVDQENNFAIRGIGTQVSTSTTDPAVAVALDGINLGRAGLNNILLNDVASIEVLNGPQGLLFGRNASAGLINITTKKPELGVVSGSFGGEYVVRDTTPNDAAAYVVRGVFNTPVGENSAFRISASIADQDALIENIFPNDGLRVDNDLERWGVRAKFLHENGPWSVYLIAEMHENNGTAGRFGRTYRAVDPDSDLVPVFEADGIVPGPENLTNSSDGAHWHDEELGGVQATIAYELENGVIIENIAGWRYFDEDEALSSDYHSVPNLLRRQVVDDYTQFSNELRVILPANESYSGQLGLFYYTSSNDITDSIDIQTGPPPFVAVNFPFCVGAVAEPGPPPACNVSNDFFLGGDSITDFSSDSYAAFGQFDFYLTDRFTATVGARVTRDEVTSDLIQGQRDYFIFLAPRAEVKESIDNTNFSWRLAGAYELNDDSMIYASLGSGYKGPGFNTDFLDIPEVPFAVQDEESTTFEIGYKSRHLDDRLIFNVTAFRTEFDDYQIQSFNLEAQGFIIQNAASVTSQGAEIGLTALLSEGLTVQWDVALLDSEFDEFDAASCAPDVGCAPGQLFWDASGQATPLASDVTSSLQGTYEMEIANGVSGYLQGAMYYRSEIGFGVGSPTRTIDDVTTWSFNAGIRTDDGWKVTLFCKNCTDEKVPNGIAFDPGQNNSGLASVNQAWGLESVRTIGLDISKEF